MFILHKNDYTKRTFNCFHFFNHDNRVLSKMSNKTIYQKCPRLRTRYKWHTWYSSGQKFSDTWSFPIEFCSKQSCKIECCGNKMHQIVQNMILTWGLEFKLCLLLRTTISRQYSLFYRCKKVCAPLLPLYFDGAEVQPTFFPSLK